MGVQIVLSSASTLKDTFSRCDYFNPVFGDEIILIKMYLFQKYNTIGCYFVKIHDERINTQFTLKNFTILIT